MFKGDSKNKCGGNFSLMSMGGQAEGLACADPGARTSIGVSGNFTLYRYRGLLRIVVSILYYFTVILLSMIFLVNLKFQPME